ncbi:STY0301 family protein [Legionella brunensis]|uniref:Uncharacterized protein n=1 Tax=Legionella brunensis TaxID=29422 RepID=A0A0W0STD3_9GAMM|nr:STY0301 family protein [Legionella brunensis]KTC86606.1 hypothetical protein Lbru_0547 [Legionella brunensis]
MSKKIPGLILFFMPIFISVVAFSSSVSIPICPEKIQVSERVILPPSGWELLAKEPNYFLEGISIYAGHPKELASLKPDFASKGKAKWSFAANDTIYVVCEYNETSIRLTKQLPEKIISCEVIYDQMVQSTKGFIPKHLNCYKEN